MAPRAEAREDEALDRLCAAVERELASPLFAHALAGVEISDASTGGVLFKRHADLLLHPASNAKCFTTAAAFTRLPGDFAFRTTAHLEGERSSPVRLWLRGAGDPLVRTENIQNLAEKIRAAGVTRIAEVAYDGGIFDALPHASGWMMEDVADESGAWISAFPIDRNKFTVTLTAPSEGGAPLTVALHPSCPPVAVSMCARSGLGENLEASFDPWKMLVTVTGTLAPGARRDVEFALARPREAFHCTLLAALAKVGIRIESNSAAVGSVPTGLPAVATIVHTLDELAALTNKRSDNLCAESILKRLGAETRGAPGSTAAGLDAERETLGRLGADTSCIELVDGSGLSFYNVTTASALAAVLRAMYRSDQKDRFVTSLAVPGEDGTLRKRMTGNRHSDWVHAKTGSIRGVSALSGYVLPPGGTPLVFVLLMQNFTGDHAPYEAAQDRIVMHCIEYCASHGLIAPSR
jgi:D-alanyl-D-alanine carboxypeptidase/D-alanyl-D-alanine-endopeptidase (penicillin-binding protein 4)